MGLFNHEIQYNRVVDSNCGTEALIVQLQYDDAFGERHSQRLVFPGKVDHVKVGGTASTDPFITSGLVVGFSDSESAVYVNAVNGRRYCCVRSSEEEIKMHCPVIVVEHLDHANGMREFNWLATTRETNFCLNSIKVMGRDENDNELCYVNIDPYIGFVNFDGMGI